MKQVEKLNSIGCFRWVCEDNRFVREAMEGSNYLNKYDITSYETMTAICNRYNKAVDAYLASVTADILTVLYCIVCILRFACFSFRTGDIYQVKKNCLAVQALSLAA